jgi:hypothetical protein
VAANAFSTASSVLIKPQNRLLDCFIPYVRVNGDGMLSTLGKIVFLNMAIQTLRTA